MTGKSLTRRELFRLLGTSAFSGLPALARASGKRQGSRPPSSGPFLQVALVRCPDYDPETLAAAIRTGWRSSRPPDVRGKRVVIKPNVVDASPDRPVHTEPRLVGALVSHLRSLGARDIVLAEGASHNRDSEWVIRQSGYEALAKGQGVRFVDLNYDDIKMVKCVNPRATLLREIALPETIATAEVLISVPKMKTHRLAGITLSMKNMFGILPGMIYGWPKNVLHWNGIPLSVGMEGYGPLLGTPRKAGVLVMGDNALAVDATAARVMGIDPARVDYLAMAHKISLGSLRREDIAVAGAGLEQVRTDFALEPEYAFLRAPKG
jgi:uncharacterized protein (DUF362 family)